ncbi:MAG: Maf family protein [Caulobacteraceae bacterium]
MIPLTLASGSATRAAILRGAGVDFEVVAPPIDENALKAALLAAGGTPPSVAADLAVAKACAVSRSCPGLVIGADQTLELDGVLGDKAPDMGAARARLTALRGRVHGLHAAVAVARDGAAVWRHVSTASLIARRFSEAFLEAYLARAGGAILASVGCYQIEGLGAQLFERIDGDYFAILGLPLFELLAFLRRQDAILV